MFNVCVRVHGIYITAVGAHDELRPTPPPIHLPTSISRQFTRHNTDFYYYRFGIFFFTYNFQDLRVVSIAAGTKRAFRKVAARARVRQSSHTAAAAAYSARHRVVIRQ